MKATYGVLAHPAGHSLSPVMQNAAFKHRKIDAEFRIFDIPPLDLPAFIKQVRTDQISGLAVSLPHKQAIIAHLDQIDQTAHEINAVNTVINQKNKLVGTNTDWVGFLAALPKNKKYRHAIVLGASGAARAVVYALKSKNIPATIINRTVSRATELAQEFNCSSVRLDQINGHNPDLVINATSVGLFPETEKALIPASWWKPHMTAFDLIYKPRITKFLSDAQKAGCTIITGEKMLLYQGAAQFKLWTGRKAPLEIMKKALKCHCDPRESGGK